MNRPRIVLITIAVLALAIPTAYDAANYSNQTGETAEQATAEYRAEAASLALPPGWKWPDPSIPSRFPDGSTVIYEKGWAKARADDDWFCAWVSRAVDPQLPEDVRQQALDTAQSMRSKYRYTHAMSPETQQSVDQALSSAVAGNTQPLRHFCGLK